MNTRILAAALVAPMIALGPASAWAHHCARAHHHHARGVEKHKYGSSRQMQNNNGSSNQKLNQGTGQSPGSTDQGAGGSSSTGGARQGI
jgi:uncharacterized membrane protein YgcG